MPCQKAKIDLLIDKLNIQASDHVLEIGCGWGECAMRMVERFGCRVTGITLSKEQLGELEAKAFSHFKKWKTILVWRSPCPDL